jgi:hypothetical protein
MLISQSEDTAFTARRFNSREEPFGDVPTLTVDYEVVLEPGTLALWGLGLIALAGVRWWVRPKGSAKIQPRTPWG